VIPTEVLLALIMVGMPSAVVLARSWFKHRERMGLLPDRAQALEQKLERLEQAVDVIALEMERVGEGQRFLAKVLAERAPDGLVPGRATPHDRPVTPH
jgi:hypothetical protein